MFKIYEYNKCDTCRKALKFLDSHGIKYNKISIVEQPPLRSELQEMLSHLKERNLSFKNLFNTSGVQYRELRISEKIKAGLSENQALDILSKNGKLIKRPFLIGNSYSTVGFNLAEWQENILWKKC